MDIIELVEKAVKDGASDIMLSANCVPYHRRLGVFQPVADWERLSNADVVGALTQITTDAQRLAFDTDQELDFAHTVEGVIRLRGVMPPCS